MTTQPTAPAVWTLAGITMRDAQCEHCGRVMARCFRVISPEGAELIVGRVCSRKLTGYSWSVSQAERAQRLAEREAAALATYGAVYADAKALCWATRRADGHPTTANAAAVDAMLAMREGSWWTTQSLEDFVADRLAVARAGQ